MSIGSTWTHLYQATKNKLFVLSCMPEVGYVGMFLCNFFKATAYMSICNIFACKSCCGYNGTFQYFNKQYYFYKKRRFEEWAKMFLQTPHWRAQVFLLDS